MFALLQGIFSFLLLFFLAIRDLDQIFIKFGSATATS